MDELDFELECLKRVLAAEMNPNPNPNPKPKQNPDPDLSSLGLTGRLSIGAALFSWSVRPPVEIAEVGVRAFLSEGKD